MGGTTVRAKSVKKSLRRTLRRVPNPAEAKELLEDLTQEAEKKVEEAPEGRVPGLAIGDTKTSWTYNDCVEKFPIVTFTPEETIPLIFNGVRVQAIEGYEMHVPKCFYTIYQQHRAMLRKPKTLPGSEQGYIPEIGPGAGALPAEEYREV